MKRIKKKIFDSNFGEDRIRVCCRAYDVHSGGTWFDVDNSEVIRGLPHSFQFFASFHTLPNLFVIDYPTI